MGVSDACAHIGGSGGGLSGRMCTTCVGGRGGGVGVAAKLFGSTMTIASYLVASYLYSIGGNRQLDLPSKYNMPAILSLARDPY